MQQVVAPGLSALGAIIIAPDVPTRAWTDAIAERAVLALVRSVMNNFNIDRSDVLVAGFSLGGRGTWFLSSRHSDVFTAAIVLAGSPADEPLRSAGESADVRHPQPRRRSVAVRTDSARSPN